MKLKNIVAYINDALCTALSDGRYDKSVFNGIAITMPRPQGDNTTDLFPVYTDDKGEGQYVGYDDAFSLQVYHKNNGVIYTQPEEEQFGNNNKVQKGVAQMSMIITGFRRALKMSPEEMTEAVLKSLPSLMDKANLTANQLMSVKINPASADFNTMAVFGREYKVKSLKALQPDIMMVELKYKIECIFDTRCINTCN